jgi:RNA polymerase sigma factor (sigma-70 family)
MSLRPNQPPHAVWLVLPHFAGTVESILRRRGVREADVEDLRQNVLERALKVSPPASEAECMVLVKKIATGVAISEWRKRRRRSVVDTGLCEEPDAQPAPDAEHDREHPIDVQRRLDVVRDAMDSKAIDARQAAILAQVIDEVPQSEIASQMKLAHSTVRNELAAARRTVRAKWALYAAATALVALGLVLWYQSTEDDHVASPPPQHQPDPDEARKLRLEALSACDHQQWAKCLDLLDEAGLDDPAGDGDPSVQKAREAAGAALDEQRSH